MSGLYVIRYNNFLVIGRTEKLFACQFPKILLDASHTNDNGIHCSILNMVTGLFGHGQFFLWANSPVTIKYVLSNMIFN